MMIDLYFMSMGILLACIPVHLIHTVPTEDSSAYIEHWIPWNGMQTVVDHSVCTENQTWVLRKDSRFS